MFAMQQQQSVNAFNKVEKRPVKRQDVSVA